MAQMIFFAHFCKKMQYFFLFLLIIQLFLLAKRIYYATLTQK